MYAVIPLSFLAMAASVAAAPAATPTDTPTATPYAHRFATPSAMPSPVASGAAIHVTPDQLIKIAPDSAQCASGNAECRTAAQAAPAICQSFIKYGVTTKGEAAAIIAIMAFESVQFQFETNQQGHPGQGTANMQSGDFNIEFAKSFPELAPKVDQILGGSVGATDEQKNAVRALLIGPGNDNYDFGSGAWFEKNKCTPDIIQGLQAGTQQGWSDYITKCVGTDVAPRQAFYDKAKAVLGM